MDESRMSGPTLTFKEESPNLTFEQRPLPDSNEIVDVSLSTGIAVDDVEKSYKVLNNKPIDIPFFERLRNIKQDIQMPALTATGAPLRGGGPVEIVPPEKQLIHQMYKAGDESMIRVEADRELGKSIVYGGNTIEALKKWKAIQSQRPLAEQFSGARGLIIKNAAVAGPMLKSYYEASPWMFGGAVVGMAIAAIGGQLGPQAAAPEEILTVPAAGYAGASVMMGVSAGATAKLSEYWYLQGVGSFYGEMIESGADPRIANVIAPIMAIPYAAIEQMQIKQLTPELRAGLQNTVLKSVMTTLRKHGERYIKTLTQEVFEEVAQEAVQIAAVDAANYLSDNGVQIDKKYFTDRVTRLNVTTVEAMKSMALLPLPDASVDVVTETAMSIPSGKRSAGEILNGYETKIKDAVNNKDFTKARAYVDLALYEARQLDQTEEMVDDLKEIPELANLWPQIDQAIEKVMTPEEAENVLGFQSEEQTRKFAEAQTAAETEIVAQKAAVEAQRDIKGGLDPVISILNALREAKKVRPQTEAEQKAELRRRVGAATGTLAKSIEKGKPVEESIFKSTGLLKGPLTEYTQLYESIRDKVEPGAIDAAFLQIYNNPKLKYFEMLDTAGAFKKLIEGTSITPREQELLWNQFGKEFGKQIQDRVPVSPLSDRLVTLWRAGLLTGIKTSGLNTLSNFSHAITETMTQITAAPVDSIMSLFTKERTTSFTMRGYLGGVKDGVKAGWDYMWTGVDERNIGQKYDYKRINFGTSKVGRALQAYTDTVFHLMGAEDEPFFYGAKARSIYNQAITQAKNQGLKGKERNAYIDKMVQSPTDDVLEMAQYDAETAVFQNRTALGDLAKDIQRSNLGKIAVPFGRTPSAVAMQIVNYSPVGTVKEMIDQIHKGKFDQRKMSQAIGRTGVGIPGLYIGTKLLSAGLMCLAYPDNEKERKLWELEGKSPNSIKIDGKWRSVFVFGPVGNVLLIGGYFQQALNDTGSPTKAITTAFTGGAKSFTEQTFIVGVNRIVDAITDPERSFENMFSSMAGSVVPTIVADIARATDDKSRRPEGPVQRIESRIPGLARKLEPRVDVFGQDLPRYGGNVLETMIDPTRPSKIRQDIVVDELRRLWNKDIKVSPTLLGDRNGFKVLSQQENTQLWHRAGQLTYNVVIELMKNPTYKNLNDEGKGKLINDVCKTAKDFARAEVVANKYHTIPEQEMRDCNLLTNDVANMIKKMGIQLGQ
jgi:hypothetical protein